MTGATLDERGAPAGCAYELDVNLRIVAVDEDWSRFAAANGAPHLLPPHPIGRPVLEYFSDPTTRIIYGELFRRLAAADLPLSFGIRCDSPQLRRFLELTIAPLPAGGFRVSTKLLRSEANPGGELLAVDAVHDGRMLKVCSWCKRALADARWQELESAIQWLRPFHEARVPRISHGICPECDERMSAELY